MVTLSGQDLLDALGIPPASATDSDWAEACAQAANAYVNALPIARLPDHMPDTLLGATMLGVNLYSRRPSGWQSGDADPSASAAIDNTVSRLLRLGYYQRPVIA